MLSKNTSKREVAIHELLSLHAPPGSQILVLPYCVAPRSCRFSRTAPVMGSPGRIRQNPCEDSSGIISDSLRNCICQSNKRRCRISRVRQKWSFTKRITRPYLYQVTQMARRKKTDIPVCCWNCGKASQDYTEQNGWNCEENRPEQMVKGLNDCPGFRYYGDNK